MLVAKLLPYARNLAMRKWSDEDIMEDVVFLHDELTTNFESISYVSNIIISLTLLIRILLCRTHDEYSFELASGHLSWTPVHKSNDFWKENVTKLNENDYKQLRSVFSLTFIDSLLVLLTSSTIFSLLK
jgi:V-type H+-transporting ATPase subunit H